MRWITLATLLLVAGYLLYVAELARIAFSAAFQHARPCWTGAGPSFALQFTDDRADSESVLLWDTQTPALQLLQSAGSKGISVRRMAKPYNELAHTYPERWEGSSFAD